MKRIYTKTLTPEEAIKRLKNGEVLKSETLKCEIKMIEGILVKFFDSGLICAGWSFGVNSDDYYFEEEEEPFKIKETGLYKTRDGQKVFVSCVGKCAVGIVEGNNTTYSWNLSGKMCKDVTIDLDIVSKWED